MNFTPLLYGIAYDMIKRLSAGLKHIEKKDNYSKCDGKSRFTYSAITERRNTMLSSEEIIQLIQSLIWLLAGVGVFIVGMNFLSDALEKSAGYGMKKLLGKISNIGIGRKDLAIDKKAECSKMLFDFCFI